MADCLILVTTNLGLAAYWVAALNVEAEPVIFTPLGYPADQPGPKICKPLNNLVHYEHW